jgi:hypothetical protein
MAGTSSYRNELEVTLTGPFPTQKTTYSYILTPDGGAVTMGLIGDAGFGKLVPKNQVVEDYKKVKLEEDRRARTVRRQYLAYLSSFSRPETAPDRTIGYEGITTLVLGQGAQRLNARQRGALRQWVISGGSVILLPGAGLDLLSIAPDAPFVKVPPVSPLLTPETPLRRYALGMGAVLTVPVDLTQDLFRERWELPYVWDKLRDRAAPIGYKDINAGLSYAASEPYPGYNDPFQIALPPLTAVVYLFTGYFLLAVPVTLVILKQTRRMNWAWATRPTLAILFAGAVYGFTADLHKSRLSRRTGGLLISAAGEKQARFTGTSELFFPTAGRYEVSIPGAETIELAAGRSYGSAPEQNDQNRRGQGNGITLRSLETLDTGTEVSIPGLSVPNLAFRRLNHAQIVDWGDGISANLTQKADGRITGTIQNRTGRVLNNAFILLSARPRSGTRQFSNRYSRHGKIVLVSCVAPGTTELGRDAKYLPIAMTGTLADIQVSEGVQSLYRKTFPLHNAAVPVLVATTSGDTLGPGIGQYVGGSDAVTVAVTLPPIHSAANGPQTVKGGAK